MSWGRQSKLCSFAGDTAIKTMMSSLFVGNLSSHVRRREFENAFRRFGRCNLELKEGYGFVVFEDYRDAKQAMDALQGRSVCGEQPSISWARKRRPFQRFSGRGNFAGRERYPLRRRLSLEADKRPDDARRDENLDEVKDDLRASEVTDEPARGIERDTEWTEMGLEKTVYDEDMKDADPLDSGRWDPQMEGSPDHTLMEKLLVDEQHLSDDKDRYDDRGSAHEKSQGSPRERHHDRSSRMYRNALDKYKRGRETYLGRQQDRCYNCGQSGHVKWQCRSRSKRINVQPREVAYDGRRNEMRYLGNRGGFRGIGGNGRFRGSKASRRFFTRDVEMTNPRKSSRRHDVNTDRKHSDRVDMKSREKSRHRRHRSESPRDSSSRGRSKKKHRFSKKSTRSTKKRQRSSSGSPSSSASPRSASSSPSKSLSHSGSKSDSSRSGSKSSDPVSRSRSSDSRCSRSHSLSASSSRSRSTSIRSERSDSLSRSKSPQSNSHVSHDISSPNVKSSSLHTSSSDRGSQSSRCVDDKEGGHSCRQELQTKEPCIMRSSDEEQNQNNPSHRSDWQGATIHDAKRTARQQMWSREVNKTQIHTRSDDEELAVKSDLQLNGMISAVKSVETDSVQLSCQRSSMGNDSVIRDPENLKGSDSICQGWAPDIESNIYVTMMKADGRVAGGIQDWGNIRFGAARLWPWEAVLYRRFKRGPISTENYERRKLQNEDFGIKDTIIRSSTGWWENHSE